MREVRWERMFPDELEQAFATCPLIYFPYGLCEPHGPYNALGLDALKAHGIACAAAHAHGGVVAPPDYWHIYELGQYAVWAEGAIGHVPRTWLTAVPPWVHFKNICYHIRAADALGFHAAIVLTGHYGPNWEDLKTLLTLLEPYVGMRMYGLPDFEANQPGFDDDGRATGDHAGKVETSLLWVLEPALVDMSRLPPTDAPGPHFAMSADAPHADRRIGERMVADDVAWLGTKGQELLAAYEQVQPQRRLRTFAEVEELWDTVIRPQLATFRTMQPINGDELGRESIWWANAPIPDRG